MLHHRGPKVVYAADLTHKNESVTVHFRKKFLNRMILTGVQFSGSGRDLSI
jgi:hypothetical protein